MMNVQPPTAVQMKKHEALIDYIRQLGSVAVAFSGGVDSAFLMDAAHEALGEKAIAVTAVSCFNPKRESDEASEWCRQRGIRHFVFNVDVLAVEGVSANPKDRCYLCKKALFSQIWRIARENGAEHLAEGSNVDDEGDYRPGLRAIAELKVLSPLRMCGLTKADIRALSRHRGLPTWNKQSFACLASRIPYGDEITEEKLDRVGRAEQLLIDLGFHQLRVRLHGGIARIELEAEEMSRLMEPALRDRIDHAFREYGFDYVTLDLRGYRTGSLNETLTAKELAAGHGVQSLLRA